MKKIYSMLFVYASVMHHTLAAELRNGYCKSILFWSGEGFFFWKYFARTAIYIFCVWKICVPGPMSGDNAHVPCIYGWLNGANTQPCAYTSFERPECLMVYDICLFYMHYKFVCIKSTNTLYAYAQCIHYTLGRHIAFCHIIFCFTIQTSEFV